MKKFLSFAILYDLSDKGQKWLFVNYYIGKIVNFIIKMIIKHLKLLGLILKKNVNFRIFGFEPLI